MEKKYTKNFQIGNLLLLVTDQISIPISKKQAILTISPLKDTQQKFKVIIRKVKYL